MQEFKSAKKKKKVDGWVGFGKGEVGDKGGKREERTR